LQKVKTSPTDDNIQRYKIIWAKTRRTIKTARRQSWQRFVSSINSRTSLNKVWNIVNKIAGKRSPIVVKHLQDGDKEVTSLADIADTLAENFSEVSSSRHYNAKVQSHKERTESHRLRFNSNNTETYNTFHNG